MHRPSPFKGRKTRTWRVLQLALEYVRDRSKSSIVIVERIEAVGIEEAARLGICGVFPGDGSVRLLAAAVQLILAGGRFLPPAWRNAPQADGLRASGRLTPRPPVEPIGERGVDKQASAMKAIDELQNASSFTSRECEIIECLRRGMQNKNIAYELGISESTVKTHLRQIMQKLGATNRTEVVSMLYG